MHELSAENCISLTPSILGVGLCLFGAVVADELPPLDFIMESIKQRETSARNGVLEWVVIERYKLISMEELQEAAGDAEIDKQTQVMIQDRKELLAKCNKFITSRRLFFNDLGYFREDCFTCEMEADPDDASTIEFNPTHMPNPSVVNTQKGEFLLSYTTDRGSRAAIFSAMPIYETDVINTRGFGLSFFLTRGKLSLGPAVEVDGGVNYILELVPDKEPETQNEKYRYWIDPQKDFAQSRVQSFKNGGKLYCESLFTSYRRYDSIWYPSEKTYTNYMYYKGKRLVSHVVKYHLKRARFNIELSDDAFDFTPPIWTKVVDYRFDPDLTYIIGEHLKEEHLGKVRLSISDLDLAINFDKQKGKPKLVPTANPPEVVVAPRRGESPSREKLPKYLIHLIPLPVSAVAIVVYAFIRRKRRRNA